MICELKPTRLRHPKRFLKLSIQSHQLIQRGLPLVLQDHSHLLYLSKILTKLNRQELGRLGTVPQQLMIQEKNFHS